MAEYIDKDKFMVILANIAKIKAKSEAQKSLMGRCMFCLDKMSAEDVVEIEERKAGKWIIDDEEYGRIWHCHCSNCKKDPQDYIGGSENWWLVRLPDYCPNCGADMRGSENDI